MRLLILSAVLFSNFVAFAISASAQANGHANLTIARVNQIVVTSWFGESGVVYQLQSSFDLVNWNDLGPAITGNGSSINFPAPIAGQARVFFRLIFPGVQSANFDSANGVLTITGDPLDDVIVVSRDATGNLLINNGAAFISGGVPIVANTTVIKIFGRDGADQIALDETKGPLPRAELYGEGGNDILAGGSGDDLLDGGLGDDTLWGMAGVDVLHGGENNDILVGGAGNDQVFGDAGNDRLVWNPGDGTDLNEGGAESDTVQVNGDNTAEVFTATANGTRVRFDRISATPFFLDLNACEFLLLNANGGNDQFSATGNLAALIAITVDGGPGDDILLGSNGADVLIGGANNDFIDGNQGNDMIYLGDGDDTAQWDPGDGSDTIEGESGNDRLIFNGSNANENIALSANGTRTRLTRDVAAVVMDLNDLEMIEVKLFGGTDNLTVNDLAGTDVAKLTAHLAAANGMGDGSLDNVFINGSPGPDNITASLSNGVLGVNGLAAVVLVDGFETASDNVRLQGQDGDDVLDASAVSSSGPVLVLEGGIGNDTVRINGGEGDEVFTATANGTRVRFDRISPAPFFVDIGTCELLALNMNGGNDQFSATGNLAALISVRVDGGAGDDILLGSNGADTLLGGDNNDFIDGNQGNDTIFLGDGDDTFQWDPGDGSDVVEGQAGNDRIVFNGSATNEIFTFFANGSRLLFTRNIGAIALDAAGVEQFDLRALAGSDTVTVNDLTGLELKQVNIDLASSIGGSSGDAQADAITVNGTTMGDVMNVIANAGAVELSGLPAGVHITHSEGTNDSLVLNGLDGNDTFNIGSGVTSLINLTTNQ